MARGLRSSRNKANKSKLRSNIFGPAETARKERLSARLLELASKSRKTPEEDADMADGGKVTTQEILGDPDAHVPATKEDMTIDPPEQPGSTRGLVSGNTSRVEKRGRGKSRAAMVFPVYKKVRRIGPRLNARERKKSSRNWKM